jgi:hypothetical protein
MTDKAEGSRGFGMLEQGEMRGVVPASSPGKVPLLATKTLRERVQAPMEDFNDPLGRLFGSRVSIHLTRLCLSLGISANAVSYAMLVCGLAGGFLLLFGQWWSVAGFTLLLLYYIFDCVDGEVARFKGDSNLEMAAFDYLTHYAVKGATFTGLTVGVMRELHNYWVLVPGMLALLATYMMKALQDIPSILFVQKLLVQRRYLDGQTILKNLQVKLAAAGHHSSVGGAAKTSGPLPLRSQLRFLLLNFDFGTLLLLGAALADVLLPTYFRLWSMAFNAKAVLLTWYGFALPLNFLDHVYTYGTGLRLHRKVDDLIRLSRETDAPSGRDRGDAS